VARAVQQFQDARNLTLRQVEHAQNVRDEIAARDESAPRERFQVGRRPQVPPREELLDEEDVARAPGAERRHEVGGGLLRPPVNRDPVARDHRSRSASLSRVTLRPPEAKAACI